MRVKGSITVFSALIFMMVASLLFALLEAARVNTLRLYADMTSELALESVFAEYQPALWQEYQLLCLDGAYGDMTFSEESITNVLGGRICTNLDTQGDGSEILKLTYTSAIPTEYQLLTDGDGSVFIHSVASMMQANLSSLAAQTLYERYVSAQEVENNFAVGDSVESASQALEAASANQTVENTEQEEVQTAQMKLEENPLEIVLACKQNLLLGMVVTDVDSLSTRALAKNSCIEQRNLQKGTGASQVSKAEWYDRILTLEYADLYYADYTSPSENHALAYELEYVVGGNESDRENLEAVVERLLLVREAANVAHIMLDEEKRLMASEVAMALAGFTVNPAIIKVVEYGLIAAWAYAESILDIRALLCGDKIALIKSGEQWASSLTNLSQILEGGFRAEDCEGGWSYQDYLKGFLFAMADRNLAYRMMDVMEQNLCMTEAYKNCRMDYMVCAVEYTITYEADSLFWNFSVLENASIDGLQYQSVQSFSYY